jgi:hypothetical protein
MKNIRAMFGLLTLSAIAIGALMAPGASAQTAHECAAAGGSGAGFKDAHCKEATASGASFKHVLLPSSFNTITLTNATTAGARSTLKLKSVQSGVTLELQAAEVEGNGTLRNRTEGATTWAEGFIHLILRKVTVTAPAGKGCSVAGVPVTFLEKAATGVIHTTELQVENFGALGQVRLEPFNVAEPFAEFDVSGCSVAALNHRYALSGWVRGTPSGATTEFTHEGTTGQGSLFLFGQKAGLEGSLTIKRESTGNGIAFT